MTTNTIKANTFTIFTAAHAEARRLRENWPNVAYRDLFRAALKGAYVDLDDNSVHYRGTCFSECRFLRDDFEAKIAAAIAA